MVLLAHARPYWRQLALVVLLAILASLAGLSIPWLAAQFLGGVVGESIKNPILVVLVLVLALVVLTGLTVASSTISAVTSNQIQSNFRRDTYAHMLRLPLTFFDQSRQGDLLALMTWEVSRLSTFIAGTLTSVPSALLTCFGALAIMFAIDPMFGVFIPILVPGYYLALKLIGRRLRYLAKQIQTAEAGIFAAAEEDLEMLPAIKTFAREEIRLAGYAAKIEKARDLNVREQKIYAFLSPVMSLVTAVAAITIVLLAGQGVRGTPMTATELFSFLLYAALLTRPVGSLANLYGQFQTARGTLERLHRVRQERPEPGYSAVKRLSNCSGDISFKDVFFSYTGRVGTLKGINLNIRSGEVVALTGANGAGKSTLVNLLLGLYIPQSGQITLDGVDIRQLNLGFLRSQIAYVPQRPMLFNGTVRQNILFGREDVHSNDIDNAASLAQALDFIKELPYGFDTEIGDHGVRLSGGQRQRIALARALLKDPPILILDEATSMYDNEGEAAFIEACKTALAGRTVILITHRPASLALAERVINLDIGSVSAVSPNG